MHPLRSDAPLIVYLDVKSPYAFVAVEPTLRLEAELGARFDWRPLTLDIPSYLGSARKSRGKVVQSKRSPAQWNMVRYAYRDARRYAERQGHVLKGTEKIWDSRLANVGILWAAQTARERLPDYLRAVYPPFWRRELDIEDAGVVEGCLRRAGIDPAGFAAFADGPGGAAHDALLARLHPAGIYGVPTYVLGGGAAGEDAARDGALGEDADGDGEPDQARMLFGREHLPYLRWRLTGRAGPAPDMAYGL